MRKPVILACTVFLLAAACGCFGPMKTMRGFDDWANQMYVDSPWLSSVMLIPVMIPAYVVTIIADVLVVNVFDFWSESGIRGEGNPYIHRNPSIPEPR